MKIVTNTVQIIYGTPPELRATDDSESFFKFNGEFLAVPEGHVFKVVGFDYDSVFLTSKKFDIVVKTDAYNSFFKETDIEV